jgi:ankyrin repeat protein
MSVTQRYFSPTIHYIETLCTKSKLILAVERGNIKKIQELIHQGYDVNTEDQDGLTALFYAIHLQNLDIIKLLIKNGADVNARNKDGNTPLLYFTCPKVSIQNTASSYYILQQKNIDIVRLLIKNGADVNAQDNNGNTPLLYALFQGDFKISEFLIKKGADVNVQDKDGNTPLAYALSMNNRNIIELLLQKGAKIDDQTDLLNSKDIKDHQGTTTCDDAAENGNGDTKQPLLNSEQYDQNESALIGDEDS